VQLKYSHGNPFNTSTAAPVSSHAGAPKARGRCPRHSSYAATPRANHSRTHPSPFLGRASCHVRWSHAWNSTSCPRASISLHRAGSAAAILGAGRSVPYRAVRSP